MIRRAAIAALLAAGVLALAGCGSSERMRYRMTVEVDTPEGVKSGSAVRELSYSDGGGFAFGEGRAHITVRGEAIAVDLPKGHTLFALLTSGSGEADYAADIFDRALRTRGVSTPAGAASMHGSFAQLFPSAPKTVGLANTNPLPMLIRFRDLADPASVERVDPAALAAAFGAGVTLKRITVQLTDDAVTSGIEQRLGWLTRSTDGGLDPTTGVTAQPTLAQQLGFLDFRRN